METRNDRRQPWDGQERRGCYFDPESAAQAIAAYLDAHQVDRQERESAERYAKFGRAVAKRLLLLAGAGIVYFAGHEKALAGFFLWLVKGE